MSRTLSNPLSTVTAMPGWGRWGVILGALAAMYLPSYWTLSQTTWTQSDHAHGPMILLAVLYMVWRQRHAIAALPAGSQPWLGWPLIATGVLMHALGRSQEVILLEAASQIPVFLGVALVTLGWGALRYLWFPILFLVFMVPLPGFLIDSATGSLKQSVSVVAEQLLYLLGYPIARTGVTLTVGPYQLMVADACSGLNSMYSLSSVGLLYLYFMQRQNLLRVAILAASILPIAYAANVVRVLVLSLLTYHFGESAGQGIVHDFASPLMFTVAVLLMVALDAVLGLVLAERPRPELAPSADRAAHRQGGHWMGTAVVSLGILASMPLAMALTPRMKVADEGPKVNLETLVPKRFGDWSMDTSLVPLQPDPGRTELINKIYNQTLTRTYVDAKGRRIMLSIAYGGDQRESMQVHKPEVCYPAQGFKVVKQSEGRLDTGAGTIPVNRLVAVQGPRVEPITYWMTIGDKVAQINSAARKLEQIKLGLTGRIPDGLLFRVSSITVDEAGAYQAQTDFVQALSQSLSEEARLRLMGHPAL